MAKKATAGSTVKTSAGEGSNSGLHQPFLRLERVRLRDFRAIADAVMELGDVTVIMGENNVGRQLFSKR